MKVSFSNIKTEKDLDALKRRLVKEKYFSAFPGNAQVLALYKERVKNGEEKISQRAELLLRKIKTKSNSGIVSVSLLMKHYPCPGNCLYCPDEKNMPKSYLSKEPAAARALMNGFDPYKQIVSRLEALRSNGHPVDKIEIIIIGGTFSGYPKDYQEYFISEIFRSVDNFGNKRPVKKGEKTLEELQKLNEKAAARVVGISIETRPDFINLDEIKRLRNFGVTKVEIGVQHLDDKVLKLNGRGASVGDVITATELLRRAGLKINYHMMLNMLGSTPCKDIAMFKKLFNDPGFQPDMLKIYPCVILSGTGLYKIWKRGKFRPYTDKQLKNILIEIKKEMPPYVRISRIIRDIPADYIISGSKISNMRQYLLADQKKNGWHCRCIRCREVREGKVSRRNIKMFSRNYEVTGGREIFFSFEDRKYDKILAFMRLYLPEDFPGIKTLQVLGGCSIVRELHTYGRLVPLSLKGKQSQHTGFGKKLLREAEKISKKAGYKKIAVISGIGAREYYRKSGYRLSGDYMVKSLS